MLRRCLIIICAFTLASCSEGYKEHHPNGRISLECERGDKGCEGAYKRFDSSGHLIETGYRSRGSTYGRRVGYFANGDTEYVAMYHDGLLDGPMTEFYPGNIKKSFGQFVRGKQAGKVLTYYPSGQIHVEEEVPVDTVTTRFVEYFQSGAIKFSALRRGSATIYYERRDSAGTIVERFPNIPIPPANADVAGSGL